MSAANGRSRSNAELCRAKYQHAQAAADACAALYLLHAAGSLLEQLPTGVSQRLRRKTLRWQKELQAESQQMLKIMDAEHAAAGVPYPYGHNAELSRVAAGEPKHDD